MNLIFKRIAGRWYVHQLEGIEVIRAACFPTMGEAFGYGLELLEEGER